MAATYPAQDRVAARFVLGGVSCVCAAIVTNPIDTIKTRMQMRGERGKGGERLIEGEGGVRVGGGRAAEGGRVGEVKVGVGGRDYRGVVTTAATIVRHETWRGLYKGKECVSERERDDNIGKMQRVLAIQSLQCKQPGKCRSR